MSHQEAIALFNAQRKAAEDVKNGLTKPKAPAPQPEQSSNVVQLPVQKHIVLSRGKGLSATIEREDPKDADAPAVTFGGIASLVLSHCPGGKLHDKLYTGDKSTAQWGILAKFRDKYRDGDHFEAAYALHLDSDDGSLTPETIKQALRGLSYFAYTSYSHSIAKPKWRVIVELKQPITNRAHYAAAIGALIEKFGAGHEFDKRSYTPDQFWFWCCINPENRALFHAFREQGEPFDASVIPVPAELPAQAAPREARPEDVERLREMLDKVTLRGEPEGGPLHEAWLKILFAAHDMTGGSMAGFEVFYGWCQGEAEGRSFQGRDSGRADVLKRWKSCGRKQDAQRVTGATLEATVRAQAVNRLTEDDLPTPDPKAKAADEAELARKREERAKQEQQKPAFDPVNQPKPPFDPNETRLGRIFDAAPPAPLFVVDRLLPQAHGVENAIGGAGKTTRHIYEAVHIILGRDLYGCKVRQGPVLILTKEDDAALFHHRIYWVCKALDLARADYDLVAEHLHLKVLTGTDERLAIADRNGNLHSTGLAERIYTGYRQEGLSLVDIDPFNMFGPGERYVNDGEAAALTAMATISLELKCAVRATSHVSKVVGREGISDAHSGRGGAAGGDNSRFVWNYWQASQEAQGKNNAKGAMIPPKLQSAANAGNLYRLHIPKLSAARAAFDSIWIVREGFAFRWEPDTLTTPQERATATAHADAAKVLSYLHQERAKGAYLTERELLKQADKVGVPGRRISSALVDLRNREQVLDADLPENLKRGGRKTYLEPQQAKGPDLDTSRPIADQVKDGGAPVQ